MPADVQRDIFDPEKEYRAGIKQQKRIAYAWDDTLDNDQAAFNALAGPARLQRTAGEASSVLIPRSLLGDYPEPALKVVGSGLVENFHVLVGTYGDSTRGAAVVHRDRVVLIDRPVTSYLDTDNWMFKGKITSAVGGASNLVINDTERVFSEAHGLVNCRVTFTSGLLNGQTIEVSHYLSATSLRLDSPHSDAPSAGDTYVIYPPALVLPDTYQIKLMSWWENTGIDVDADLEDDGLVTPVTDAVPSYRRRLHWCLYADNGATSFPDNDVNGWYDSLYVDTIATLTVSSGTIVTLDDIVLADGVYTPVGSLLNNVLDAAYQVASNHFVSEYVPAKGVTNHYPVTYIGSLSPGGTDVTLTGGLLRPELCEAGLFYTTADGVQVNTNGGSSAGIVYYSAPDPTVLKYAQSPALTSTATPLVALDLNDSNSQVIDSYSLAGRVARYGADYYCDQIAISFQPGRIEHGGRAYVIPAGRMLADASADAALTGDGFWYVYRHNTAVEDRLLSGLVLSQTQPFADGTPPAIPATFTGSANCSFCCCIGVVYYDHDTTTFHGIFRGNKVYFSQDTVPLVTLTTSGSWTSVTLPRAARAACVRMQPTMADAGDSTLAFAVRVYDSTATQTYYTDFAAALINNSTDATTLLSLEFPLFEIYTKTAIQLEIVTTDSSPSCAVQLQWLAWDDAMSSNADWSLA